MKKFGLDLDPDLAQIHQTKSLDPDPYEANCLDPDTKRLFLVQSVNMVSIIYNGPRLFTSYL